MSALLWFSLGVLFVHAGNWLLCRVAGHRLLLWRRVAELSHEAAVAGKQANATGWIAEIIPSMSTIGASGFVPLRPYAVRVEYPEPVGFTLGDCVRISVIEKDDGRHD